MSEKKFIFITPSQYNKIYSNDSGILINSKISNDTIYLSQEIRIKEQELEQIRAFKQEALDVIGAQLSALKSIEPVHNVVCDHYLAYEWQAKVIGAKDSELRERIKRFWEARSSFESAYEEIGKFLLKHGDK